MYTIYVYLLHDIPTHIGIGNLADCWIYHTVLCILFILTGYILMTIFVLIPY